MLYLTNYTHCSSSCHYIRKTLHGDAGFICPKCHSYTLSDIKANRELHDNEVVQVKMYTVYEIQCPECGTKYVWDSDPLDPNITPYIAELNAKGYKTMFSCEGHKGHHQAYIMFCSADIRKVLETCPLPAPWYIDENEFFDLLSYHKVKRLTIRCDDKSLKVRMETLSKWVKSLPEWTN